MRIETMDKRVGDLWSSVYNEKKKVENGSREYWLYMEIMSQLEQIKTAIAVYKE